MKQQIFLKDYEDFLKHRKEFFSKKVENLQKIMDDEQEEYEKSLAYRIFYKKFGWSSFKKYSRDLFDHVFSDHCHYVDHVEEICTMLLKVEYNRKSLEMINCTDIDNHFVENEYGDTFFSWAKKNNRPY